MTHLMDLGILYLQRSDVEQVCTHIDSISVMRDVFALHGLGQTILPDEAYLSWTNSRGETVRSLNMPAALGGGTVYAGTKIINSNIHNPSRGLPRASGVTLLYDADTTRILCIMEAAYLSALRTASVSALSIDLVKGHDITTLVIIGVGVLAQAHLQLLIKHLPHLETVYVYDIDSERIAHLQQVAESLIEAASAHVTLQVAATAREAICAAQVIIPTTTTTTGYIESDWLQPGSILVNVSLDDPLPEVVFQADTVIVDDWNLVRADSRRLLGRMYREGQICGPDEMPPANSLRVRSIDAQLGELVLGTKVGRKTLNDRILVNPFGLAIEDVALAAQVYQIASMRKMGVWLPR